MKRREKMIKNDKNTETKKNVMNWYDRCVSTFGMNYGISRQEFEGFIETTLSDEPAI